MTNSFNIQGFMEPSVYNLVSLWVKCSPPAVAGASLRGVLHAGHPGQLSSALQICEAAGATLAYVSYSPCPRALV